MHLFGLPVPPRIRGPFLVSGESTYVGRGCLRDVLEFCVENHFVILGMEGFTTDGSSIIPNLDFIADFGEIEGGWNEQVRSAGAAARSVADRWQVLDGFEFVDITAVTQEP
jgi:hypothetical protein